VKSPPLFLQSRDGGRPWRVPNDGADASILPSSPSGDTTGDLGLTPSNLLNSSSGRSETDVFAAFHFLFFAFMVDWTSSISFCFFCLNSGESTAGSMDFSSVFPPHAGQGVSTSGVADAQIPEEGSGD